MDSKKNRPRSSQNKNIKRKKKRNSSHQTRTSKDRLRKMKKHKGKKRLKKVQNRQLKIKQLMIQVGVSLTIFSMLLKLVSIFTFSLIKIDGYDMMPIANDGEWVIVNKLSKLRRFKLVAFKEPHSQKVIIQRVIGLPGENIFYEDDTLYVNYREVDERFLEEQLNRAKSTQTLFTKNWTKDGEAIPEDKFFVLGDNRPYALDSREFGYIDKKDLIGVVELRVLPIHSLKQF